VSDTEIIGHLQLRATHLRYTAPDHMVEEKRGHSHATNEHYYHKVDGVWKFAGLKLYIRKNEY
jgi:scytalone dehydratase